MMLMPPSIASWLRKVQSFFAPRFLLIPALALGILTWSCAGPLYDPLPRIERSVSQPALPDNPHNGTLLSWNGSRTNLRTFWGSQDIRAHVRAFIPSNWARPGDGTWRVRARNGEAKPVPFLGVLRTSEGGAEIIPEIRITRLPDGLYSLIEPGVEKKHRELVSVRPRLLVCEIRNSRFQPFRVTIPLNPLHNSSLTAPTGSGPIEETSPKGTPYPFTLPKQERE